MVAVLRAVDGPEGEFESPVGRLSVAEAAASGDHRALLVAMRDRIAVTVQDPKCPPKDLAALTRRLTDIAKELRALKLAEEQEADEGVPDDEEFDPASV